MCLASPCAGFPEAGSSSLFPFQSLEFVWAQPKTVACQFWQNSCQPLRYLGWLCRDLSCHKRRDLPASAVWKALIWWDGWSGSGQWWLDSVTSAMGWGCAWLALQQLVLFWSSWWMEPVLSSFCYISNQDNFSVSCHICGPKPVLSLGEVSERWRFPQLSALLPAVEAAYAASILCILRI